MMKTIYIVQYRMIDPPEWWPVTIFATNSKRTAKRYCKRFNDRLRHWQDHYRLFQDCSGAFMGPDELFDRWLQLKETGEATYYSLGLR